MRIKHLLYLLLALPLAFVACNDPEEPAPAQKNPILNVTETTLNFGAEGAEGTIHYAVENAVEGTDVTATCAAEWISDLTVAENITFIVEANEGEARETTIVVAYGDLSKSVAVKQAAKGEEPEPEPEYVMDVELAAAMRIPSSEVELADNNFVLFMTDDAENIELGIVLVGAEGETILQAGDYVSEDGSFMADGCELYIWEPEGYYRFSDGAATVALDGETYSLDIELLSEDEELFHFTFEGPILDMVPAEKPEPEVFVPVKVEACREADWATGNFELDLYINEEQYHSLDMQDMSNFPNNDYLTAGNYSYEDGSITSWSNIIYKVETGEGAYLTAAEIELTHNEDGTSTIKGYFESEYGQHFDIDWTGVIAGFNFAKEEPGETVEFNASFFGGTHYNVGNHNYYIVLSNVEADGTGAIDGGIYYYFDIYSDEVNDDLTVPNGVYTFDLNNSYASGTFSEEYGYGMTFTGTTPTWYLYDEGSKVTVSDNKIVAELILTDGTKHVVTYEGSTSLSEAGGDGLTEDMEINATGWDVSVEYYGQFYSDPTDNWYINIFEDADTGNGGWFVLDLLADYATSVDHSGTFTGADTMEVNTFMPGYIEDGYLAGTWYAELEDGEISGKMVPICGGTITVTLNGDGTETYTFDCEDDQGYKITGSVTANPYSSGYALSKGAQPKAKSYTMQLPKSVVR